MISCRADPPPTGMTDTPTPFYSPLYPPQRRLTVARERAYLAVAGTLFGWVHVDRLELEIPPGELAVDPEDAPALYQRRRCRVAAAALSIDDAGLESLAFRLTRELGERAGGELRLRVL